MAKKAKAEPARGFEELLAETEEIVDTLEAGEMSLEEALKSYEAGVANLRACVSQIQAAEEKVQVLVREAEDVFRLEALDADALTDEDEDD